MPLRHPIGIEPMDEDEAYKRGRDYALNGATDHNCNFAIFCTKANTAAWERGRDEAIAESD